jgi:hypothetical protein
MRRIEFIKKVLKSTANTVFTTKEQVEVALKIFEKLGMVPPETRTSSNEFPQDDFKIHKWDD